MLFRSDAAPTASGCTGRRPGKPDTRAHILRVAGDVFRRQGYGPASVRGIAREAGVDQALVHRYFGTKRDLFLAAVWLGFDVTKVPARIAAGGPDGMGVRLMSTLTAIWETPLAAHMVAALRETPSLLGEIPP